MVQNSIHLITSLLGRQEFIWHRLLRDRELCNIVYGIIDSKDMVLLGAKSRICFKHYRITSIGPAWEVLDDIEYDLHGVGGLCGRLWV